MSIHLAHSKPARRGFGVVEIIVIILIAGVIAGGIWWALKPKPPAENSTKTTQSSPTPVAGTTSAINATVSEELSNEVAADSTGADKEKTALSNEQTASKNVAESFNETNY